MNCFECGTICLTVYGIEHTWTGLEGMTRWVVNPMLSKITHVRKDCQDCGWTSHPTKIPESL